MEHNFKYLEGKFDQAAEMNLVQLACLLEDAIDIHDRHWKIHWMLNFAQLSATLNLRAVMEKTHGKIDEQLLGRLQNSAKDRNWDSIEALWKMKEEAKADTVLAAAFKHETAGEIIAALKTTRARQALHRRAGRAVPEGIRLARRLEPRVHLPDRARAHGAGDRARPRLHRDQLRLPEDGQGAWRPTSPPPRRRSSRASAARRSPR